MFYTIVLNNICKLTDSNNSMQSIHLIQFNNIIDQFDDADDDDDDEQ